MPRIFIIIIVRRQMMPDDLEMALRMDRGLLELLNAEAEDSSCSHLLF